MKSARFLLCALAALSFLGCSQDGGGNAAASDSPEAVVLSGVNALKNNDMKSFLKTVMPAEAMAEMRAEYDRSRAEPVGASEAAQFNETMSKLTADNAADLLFAEMQPQLAQMAPQLPFLVGMVRGMGASSIQQQEDLSAAEKEQAQKALDAVGRWAEQADLASEDNLRSAINAAVATARKLDIESLEQARGLEFDDMLGKADIVFAGAKDVMKVYGLDLDSVLGSVRAEQISSEGDAANLKVSFDLLGEEFSTEAPMVKTAEGWFADGAAAGG